MIVYKEYEGLSTYYVKDKRDVPKPNYPVPAIRYVAEWAPMYGGHWRVYNHYKPGVNRVWIDDWGLGNNSLFTG